MWIKLSTSKNSVVTVKKNQPDVAIKTGLFHTLDSWKYLLAC